ncbi:MAG: TIR domain-containing protein, partial [Crocosphaera sp.]|nr:TIR domain-containing protein [Crocosphaera sp.]
MTISSKTPSFGKITSNKGKFDVFLLASERDRTIRDKIHESLMRQGLTVWEQPDNLTETLLKENSLQAIAQAGVIIYLLSASSQHSAMCKEELALALKDKKRIVPVILEKSVLKSFLPPILRTPWIDLTNYDDQGEYAKGVQQLVNLIQLPKPKAASPNLSIRQQRNYRQWTMGLLIVALVLGIGGLSWGGMTWFNQVNADKEEAITLANQAQAQATETLARGQEALKEAKDAKTNLSIVIAREKAAKAEAAKALKGEKDAKTNLSIVIAREKAAKAEAAKALKGEKDA